MKVPNLRTMEVTEGMAKDVRDTKLLSTTAREPADTVKSDNPQKERVVSGGTPSGPFGNKGRS